MLVAHHDLKIGLALGGGGARGLAHIGVLKVLERENIPVSFLAGTSMGGIIGVAYAAGMDLVDFEAELNTKSSLNEIIKLVDFSFSTKGLFGGRRLYRYFKDILGPDLAFNDLQIPAALQAVDLNTGREVTLRSGSVIKAMRATMSVPGFFAPFEVDNYRLVDGGVLNNVPANIVRSMGARRVIAIDVLPNYRANTPGQPPVVEPFRFGKLEAITGSMWEVLLPMVAALTETHLKRARPDVIIRPALPPQVTLFSGFTDVQKIIDLGVAAAEAHLDEIRDLLDPSITPPPNPCADDPLNPATLD